VLKQLYSKYPDPYLFTLSVALVAVIVVVVVQVCLLLTLLKVILFHCIFRCLQVHLECAGVFQTLFVVTGSCQGLEIALDVDSVTFGAVVQNSSSARQFIMNNTGDVGAR